MTTEEFELLWMQTSEAERQALMAEVEAQREQAEAMADMLMEEEIRRATDADIALLHELGDVAFRDAYKRILTPAQIDYMMEWMYSPDSIRRQMAEGHVWFICERRGVPVGYVSVQPQGVADDGRPLWHLQKLYVVPELKGDGIGGSLFRHALAFMRTESGGACHVELNVNRANTAVGFYRRMGMKILRQGDFPIGGGFFMNDYIMGCSPGLDEATL